MLKEDCLYIFTFSKSELTPDPDVWSACYDVNWLRLAATFYWISLCIHLEQIIFLGRPPRSDPTPGMCDIFRGIGPALDQTNKISGLFSEIQTTVQRHATVFRTGRWASSFRPLVRMCDSRSCSLFDFSYYASGTLGAVKNILYDKKPHTFTYLCSRPGPGIFHYFHKWFSRWSLL